MGRHVFRIKRDREMATSEEQLIGNRRYRDEAGGMRHPFRILGRPEYGDLVVRCPKGFDPFVCLLTVIETGRHAMYSEVRVLDEFGLTPFPGFDAVVRLDVPID